jgi:aspartyl-tRNA(Asn)/glutamyl-tRNA(Gln) amidotransferase subunit C
MKAHMALSREQVLHVAALARLALSAQEVDQLTQDLGQILGHIDQLNGLDTSGVDATEYIAVDRLPLRADEPQPSLSTAEALASAPRAMNDGFVVPAFVDS